MMTKTIRLSIPRDVLFIATATLLLSACTTQQIMNAALSKDPTAALKSMGQNKVETYKRNPQALINDFDKLKVELDHLFGNVQQASEKKWGKEESETLPSAKRYVKYTEQYKNRIIVDYEKGKIRIEHIQESQAPEKLRGAIVVALLTPEDPKSTDVFSDKDVILDGKPFLQDLVLNQNKQVMNTREDVENYAGYLVANRLKTRKIRVGGTPVDVVYVEIEMIGAEQDRIAAATPSKKAPKKSPKKGAPQQPVDQQPDQYANEREDTNKYGSADKIAPKFLPIVNKYAQTTGVDPALIFGVIYQESRFNPHAVSSAEAYGMMQLVPKSGGLEAFRKAKGETVQPTKEYLMDPENNIELGATYLGMLLFEYWTKHVGNIPAREYCAISGYNTGPGNVARAFSGSTRKVAEAQDKANSMRPDELFDYLRANLPYPETRDYLLHVTAARRHYKEMFYPDTPLSKTGSDGLPGG
jgi:membrane-bound lytic murein transglycosylase C